MTDFPVGNGDPSCPKCFGRGVVSVEDEGITGGATRDCSCVYMHDIRANLTRIWPGLLEVELIETSLLKGRTSENLRITSSTPELKRHLRHVGVRMGTRWSARVVSDADLMSAWLATVAEALDPDVTTARIRSKGEFFTLSDIALAHDLLIIFTGIKVAKNKEMPGVLLEAIRERAMALKATWLVDSPSKPLREGHVSYSDDLWNDVKEWDWIVLSDGTERPMPEGVMGPAQRAALQKPVAGSPRQVQAPKKYIPRDDDDDISSILGDAPLSKEDRQARDDKAKKAKQKAKRFSR